ncbi:MAG: hypothetical protein Q4B22_06360 [Eubacteriales bacterium]|nr:hypothetical protein [Eubacteriales bacterium]
MAFNPMMFMKIRERLTIFQQQHPRVMPFFQAVGAQSIREGTVLELKVTDPEGKSYVSNIRLTADDIETIQMMKEMNMQQ